MTMTKINVKKGSMLAAITATIIALAVFSPTITQDILAAQTNPITKAELDMKLANAHQILTEKMVKKNTTDIPVVLSFVDPQTSTLVIGIDSDAKLPVSAYGDRLKAVVGDVPTKIVSGKFVRDACPNRTSDPCRPLWGGVQVHVPATGLLGTLSIRATSNSGTTGFIMSGHVAGIYGTTGDSVYQNDNTPTSNLAGTVNLNPTLNGQTRSADAAFIQLANGVSIENKIYKASNSAYTVGSKLGTIYTPSGTNIKMMSKDNGEISGTVSATGVTVSDPVGTLTDQVRASWTGYTTINGDSGAPIYSPPSNNQVNFYGIHVGKFCVGAPTPCGGTVYPIYSSWDAGLNKGIKYHLNLSS